MLVAAFVTKVVLKLLKSLSSRSCERAVAEETV